MKILVIGGTQFVGRAMAEVALAKGHELTLFNRGRTGADLFPHAEKLVGDRDGGLDVLDGRQWDAVIDTCGYVPRLVKDSATKLKDAVQTYCFVSTISVYGDTSQTGIVETSPINREMEDPTSEEITGETYGPLKALCEDEVTAAFPTNHLIIRPGLVT
ncbi:MAG: NAD-dependent epimerase/dehydratase family protein, partial [Chloroflexota bacterium]